MRARWSIRFLTFLIALAAIGGPGALILKLKDPARFQQLADQGRAWAEQAVERVRAMLPQP